MGAAADRLNRVGDRLRALPGDGVAAGTEKVRKAALDSLRRDAGSDRKLSGLGPRGRPLTVKRIVRADDAAGRVDGRVMAGPARQRAPWFWLEEGTAPGRRGPKVGRESSRRKFRGQHPGTPAKQTWSSAVAPVLDEVRSDFETAFRRAVKG